MNSRQFVRLAIAMLCFGGSFQPTQVAAQYCLAQRETLLTEYGTDSDFLVVGQRIKGVRNLGERPGSTEFEIVEVIHQSQGEPDQQPVNRLEMGSRIKLASYVKGKAGDLFLVAGSLQDGKLVWNSIFPTTPAALKFRADAPKPNDPAAARLKYRFPFFESTDESIEYDVSYTFGEASLSELAEVAGNFPRLKLGELLTTTPNTSGRLGVYGLMLGLHGNADDADVLEAKILETGPEFRLGITGVMEGYLMLTGEKGLAVLEEKILNGKRIAFSEVYAVMQTIRFIWNLDDKRISPDRLRQSMRILLDRPQVTDLVIADLVRMKDWDVLDRVMKLYGEGEFDTPPVKRAIVRFLLAASKDDGAKNEAEGATPIAHVVKAQVHLKDLEERDPQIVKDAKHHPLF